MTEEVKNKESNVLTIVFTILHEWRTLVKFVGVFAVLGVLFALTTPKTYTAKVVMVPEISAGGSGLSGNLADVASSFGIDLSSRQSVDAIYPELYPAIFSSTDFLRGLLYVHVRLKGDKTTKTYKSHLEKDLHFPILTWLRFCSKSDILAVDSKDPYKLSKDEIGLCKAISSSIKCDIDKKTNEITICVTDQDPLVAAIMADTLQLRLQEYITDYRTKKAHNDYEYYKKMMLDAKKTYESSQRRYAGYSDANMDVIMQSVNAHRDQLENEMQLQYNVYNQMAAQMKQAEARIQERTPAFTIIQKPYMPMIPSSRPRSVTVLFFVVIGFLLDSFWIFWRKDIYNMFKK